MNLTIYSKSGCCYCEYAEKLCDSYGINYKKIDYQDMLLTTEKLHGVTFPKIYNNGNDFIGGYMELVNTLKPTYNYEKLKNLSKVLTYNLNKIIDYNFYPIPETERSNLRHRPIGLGVQGLANVFYEMKIPFGSSESKEINKNIFESIYYGSLEASMEIARDRSKLMERYMVWKNQIRDAAIYQDFVTSEEYEEIIDKLGNILPGKLKEMNIWELILVISVLHFTMVNSSLIYGTKQ